MRVRHLLLLLTLAATMLFGKANAQGVYDLMRGSDTPVQNVIRDIENTLPTDVTNPTLLVRLPVGVEFGSVVGIAGPSINLGPISPDGSNITRIRFSGVWEQGSKLTLTYTRTARCGAEPKAQVFDEAWIDGSSSPSFSQGYVIAEPLVEFVNPSVSMVTMVAGETYAYEGKLMNTRAGTYTSSFQLLFEHVNFVGFSELTLTANSRQVVVPSSKISNPSGNIAKTLVLIDKELLVALGYANGLYIDNNPIDVRFSIVPTEKACGTAAAITATTTTLCTTTSVKPVADRNFKIYAPGLMINSLSFKRQTIDFPDAANNGTVNGDWQWVVPGGVLPDYSVVKGGDAALVSVKGKVYLSPLMPSVKYIVAELSFSDGKHKEFDWASGLELVVTKALGGTSSTPLIAAVTNTSAAVTYKLFLPPSIVLEANDEVELKISATMREDAQTSGVATMQAELLASASENVKLPECRNTEQSNFNRVVIDDRLALNSPVITAGCAKAFSEVVFSSQKAGNLQGGDFANELRSYHYMKEVRVYVPAGTKVVSVAMLDGASNMGITLPSPITTTYIDGGKTYYNALMYVFDLTSYYGTYGVSAVFKDEQAHIVSMKLGLEFEEINSESLKTESIKYSVKPVNPSTDKTLPELSISQPILYPTIKPVMTVLDAQPRFSFSNKRVVWTLTISNTSIGAVDLDGLKLELVPQAGAMSNLSVTYISPQGLPSASVVGLQASLHKLEAASTKNVHVIEVEATVNEACSEVTPVQLRLTYDPCGTNHPILLQTLDVSCKRDNAELWLSQTGTTGASRTVSVCTNFELDVKMSVSREPVVEPYIDIILPENSAGFTAVDLVSVREEAINGVYGAEQVIGSTRVERISSNIVRYHIERSTVEESTPLNLKLKFAPTCNFSNGVKINARPYAKYFCTTYNAVNSGAEFSISESLEDPALATAFSASVTFSPSSTLIFDKVNNRKTTVLKIKKTSGGAATAADKIQLLMPASLRLATLPATADPEQLIGTGVEAKRLITWSALALNSGIEQSYALEFIMDNPSAYNDLLNGDITVSVVNKLPSVPCPGGPQPTCTGIELIAGKGSVRYSIVDVFPVLAKAVKVKKKSLLDFTFTYTFTIKNLGDLPVRNLQLVDALDTFYDMGLPTNMSITTTSPTLLVNTAYDGKVHTSLLAAGSILQPKETQLVTLSFDMKFSDVWKDKTFVIKNTSIVTGTNEYGTEYEDKSNSGTEPQIDTDGETVTDPLDTKIPELIFEPVIDSNMPPGFGLITNGVECFEGDTGEAKLKFIVKLKDGKPLDYRLCFTVFSRDGIATVSDADYKPFPSTSMCIEEGDITTKNSIIEVPVVGDTKFESDEDCFLDMKAGTGEMKYTPARILILNDDPRPNIYIPDDGIALVGDEGLNNLHVVSIQTPQFSKTEGTSTSAMTKFVYRVTLNAPAPQPFTVSVKSGGTVDDAKPNADYTPIDKTYEIPTGSSSVDIVVDVVPDNIPENDEVFSLVFKLAAGGVDIQECTRVTAIRNDDAVHDLSENLLVTYCLNDDEATQHAKLQRAIEKQATAPVGYEERWYTNGVGGSPVATPTVASSYAGMSYAYFLAWYNPSENYETVSRTMVTLYIQPEPTWTLTTHPASPVKLLTGQSLVVSVAPTDFSGYNFMLNGVLEASGTQAATAIYSSKLTPQSNIQVEVTDKEGCKWDRSLNLSVEVVELPNAFIPEGGDSENKIFLKDLDISIFNRWGHLLYKGSEGWDGRYKGAFVAPGTYYYVVNMPDGNGKFMKVKGSVMLVGPSRN